jgi:hypothetical protein
MRLRGRHGLVFEFLAHRPRASSVQRWEILQHPVIAFGSHESRPASLWLGAGTEFLFVLEEQEVMADLFLGELVGGLAVVLGELADRSQISLLRPLAQSSQLHVVGHLLT